MDCKNCGDKPACIPFFALVCVCVTFVLTIIVFVTGYTAREKNWLDTLQKTGVTDGVHEQPDP